MALINDPNIAAQIAALAATGQIDTTILVDLINQSLPPGQQLSTGAGVATGVYKRFGEFDKINARVEVVTTGLWTGDEGSLTDAFTSSVQVLTQTSANYYYNVYNVDPMGASADSAEVQYAVAWGHYSGLGSVALSTDDTATLPAKATYAQYKSILLDPSDNKFSFQSGSGVFGDSDSIYVINVARARFREKMDPGNWQLTLTGANGTKTLIDDSGKKFGDTLGRAGRVFNVVEGDLNLGTENEATVTSTYSPTTQQGYGLFYPDRGIIILNPTALQELVGSVSAGTLAGDLGTNSEKQNHKRLLQAIVAGGDFQARRTENVSTQHFFVRATNREFNFSNNPTYVDANGDFAEATFEADPKTYITTVGLLNDSNELIAVAKTSQPIAKSFDKEVLIKVKLSF